MTRHLRTRPLACLALAATVAVALTACGDLTAPPTAPAAGPVATTVTAPVARLDVTMQATIVFVGSDWTIDAVPRDAQNVALTGRAVAWTSSDTSVVGVDAQTGRATAQRSGVATITARCAGTTGSVTVRVIALDVLVPHPVPMLMPATDSVRVLPVEAWPVLKLAPDSGRVAPIDSWPVLKVPVDTGRVFKVEPWPVLKVPVEPEA